MEQYKVYLKKKYSQNKYFVENEANSIEQECRLGGLNKLWAYIYSKRTELLSWKEISDAIFYNASNQENKLLIPPSYLAQYVLHTDIRWNTYSIYANMLPRYYGNTTLMNYLHIYYPITEWMDDLKKCVLLNGVFTGTSQIAIIVYFKLKVSLEVIMNILALPFEISDCTYILQDEFIEYIRYHKFTIPSHNIHYSHNRILFFLNRDTMISYKNPYLNLSTCTCVTNKNKLYTKCICTCVAHDNEGIEAWHTFYQEKIIESNTVSFQQRRYLKKYIKNLSKYIVMPDMKQMFSLFYLRMLSLTDKDHVRSNMLKKINTKHVFEEHLASMFPKEMDWLMRYTYTKNVLNKSTIYFPYSIKEDLCVGAYTCCNDTIIDMKSISLCENTGKLIIFLICIDSYGYAMYASQIEKTFVHVIPNIQNYINNILMDDYQIYTSSIDKCGILWRENDSSVYGCYCTLYMDKMIDIHLSTKWASFSLFCLYNPMINRVLRYGIVHTYTRCMYTSDDVFLIYTPHYTIRVFSNGIIQKIHLTNATESFIEGQIVYECYCNSIHHNTDLYHIALDALIHEEI
jgi:hypothetical protein